jgi:hypothetical protein
MKKLVSLLLCLVLSSASAQVPMTGAGLGSPTVVAGYQGPGNILSGALAMYGLRAYNGAYAASLGKSVNACNPGDAAPCVDLSVNSSGALVVPAAIGGVSCSQTISAGTYVSATGALSLTTTLGANLSSGNIFALSSLTGTGSVSGLQLLLTATTGTTGTTVNATAPTGLGTVVITGGTISVCTIKIVYDQTGNSCNLTQATITTRPILTINAIGSLPGMQFSTANSTNLLGTCNLIQAQPLSASLVVNQSGALPGNGFVLSDNNAGAGIFFPTAAGNIALFSGSISASVSVAQGVFHAIQAVFNGSSSTLMVNGVTTSSLNPGTGGLNTEVSLGGYATFPFNGLELEEIYYPGSISGTNQTALNNNQRAYWGF